jgi:sec-independent protein translocase protein TatC
MRLPFARRAPGTRPVDGSMPLIEHLGELRRRLIIALIALAVGAVVGFLLYNTVLEWLVEPYCDVKHSVDPNASCKLVVTDPLESFSIRLKVSTYIGFVIASPVILWQLWRFITSGTRCRSSRRRSPCS